jgi:hypothetical protein
MIPAKEPTEKKAKTIGRLALPERVARYNDMIPPKAPPEKKPETIHRLTLRQLSRANSERLTYDDLGIVNDRDRRIEWTGTT